MKEFEPSSSYLENEEEKKKRKEKIGTEQEKNYSPIRM